VSISVIIREGHVCRSGHLVVYRLVCIWTARRYINLYQHEVQSVFLLYYASYS